MEFITTGQRLAVENFSYGTIYKVKFLDDTEAYMMCSGIGSNLIMLMSSEPRLFALTIDSASLIDTIDIHDPTPPEPPTPIENALQYQTGEPPFTFTTTGNKLFSWYIEGACGDKTANLSPNNTFTNTATDTRSYLSLAFQAYSDSGFLNQNLTNVQENKRAIVTLTASSGTTRLTVVHNGATQNIRIVPYFSAEAGKYTLVADVTGYNPTVEGGIVLSNIMILSGEYTLETIPPYEPTGYKIPISCNSHTEMIYLDEPLAEGEKLYSVNTNTEIITDIGENTLTVDTTETPTMQIVYKIYAERG